MDSQEAPEITGRQEVFVVPHAFEVAKGWLKNMTGGADFDTEAEKDDVAEESRPWRLGLGAKFLPHSQAAYASTPVGQALKKQINAKRKAAEETEKEQENQSGGKGENQEDDGESRCGAIKRKTQTAVPPPPAQPGKKKKNKRKRKREQQQQRQ